MLGELREELGISGLIAAAHGAMFGIGLLVVGVFGLSFVARIGRARAYWGACVAVVAGVMILNLGRSWPMTVFGCLISGFACAFMVMLMPSILADHHGENRAAAFAAVNGFPGVIGIVFSLAIGAAIASGISWRWPYTATTLAIAIVVVVLRHGITLPPGTASKTKVLPLLRQRDVIQPWLGIVHAVLVKFTVGIFVVVYLKEAGGASGGTAAALGSVWGLCLFLARLLMPRFVRVFGLWSRTVSYLVAACGVLLMWSGPSLGIRVVGLVIVGFGASTLFPLAVDRLYLREGSDTVALGAIVALGSGTAVVIGPTTMGLLSDSIGVRNSILIVPVLAVLGAFVCLPSRQHARAG